MNRIAMITYHGDPTATLGSPDQGGQPLYVRAVSEKLADRGYRVYVFTRLQQRRGDREVDICPGAKVVRLKAGAAEPIEKEKLYPHLGQFYRNLVKYFRTREMSCSLIHGNYWLSGVVGLKLRKSLKVPLVQTFHSLGRVKYGIMGQEMGEIGETRLRREDEIMSGADAVIATSPQEIENISQLYSVSRDRIHLIPAGVHTGLFRAIESKKARKKIGLKRRRMILFVGRITKAKGIRSLIRAVPIINSQVGEPLKVMIAGGDKRGGGESKEKRFLMELISALSIEEIVDFVGPIPRNELPYYYSAADVCVIPSHYESFGLVAVEAMACGTPVVASEVGGLMYTVKNGYTGFHVVPRSVKMLANKVVRLIEDERMAEKMGENAKERVRREFTWTLAVNQLDSLYQKLLRKNS